MKNKNQKIWITSERAGNTTYYMVMYKQNRYSQPQELAIYAKSRMRAEKFIKGLRSALMSA
jgi:hypothetical protein